VRAVGRGGSAPATGVQRRACLCMRLRLRADSVAAARKRIHGGPRAADPRARRVKRARDAVQNQSRRAHGERAAAPGPRAACCRQVPRPALLPAAKRASCAAALKPLPGCGAAPPRASGAPAQGAAAPAAAAAAASPPFRTACSAAGAADSRRQMCGAAAVWRCARICRTARASRLRVRRLRTPAHGSNGGAPEKAGAR
jgi:hypothetical protein